MNKIAKNILSFCEELKLKENKDISETMEIKNSCSVLSDYINKNVPKDRLDDLIDYIKEDIEEIVSEGIEVIDSNKFLFYLFSPKLKWNKHGFKGKDGNWINPINGGFCINSIYEMLISEQEKFWERASKKYQDYEPYTKEDFELLNQLAWFDSPTSFVDRAITPFYTCLKIEEGKFPTEFYFYDSHLVYQLPFTSYEAYFEALFASSCIECWQFFYIKPTELIKRNKGKCYFTVFLKSPKIENQNTINFEPEVKEDRLDVIHGYLEHCVTALPEIFPEKDFSHHIKWFKEFDKLYIESKNYVE